MPLASVQWSNSAWNASDPAQVLANVIQGEAGTPDGQLAVATVMQNRLNSGDFGSSIQQVVTPSQFNGWQPATSGSNAYSLAQQLLAGTPLPASAAGNSLYFASPASNNANWANPSNPNSIVNTGVNIGGNFFSDVMGAPSSNFSGNPVPTQTNGQASPGVTTSGPGVTTSGQASVSSSAPGVTTSGSGSNWLETILLNTKALFQRGIIGALGLILVLGALWYLAASRERTA